MICWSRRLVGLCFASTLAAVVCANLREARGQSISKEAPLAGDFRWTTGQPLLLPRDVAGISCYSIKDPSVVRYDNRWHLFCTIRGKQRSHAIVYVSFGDWSEADAARQLLPMHDGYFCAPQVFYFKPQKRWYLICQAASDEWNPKYQPAFATTDQIGNPKSWSRLQPLYGRKPENVRAWLDFWVICDQSHAHLFFTSLDGNMWRSQTPLADFPHNWSKPEAAIQGDVFEASHTYRLKGREEYLTLIEAQGVQGRRYYKAYTAPELAGPWKPLAATKERAFASLRNVEQPMRHWTDSISHGELLRDGYDEQLEVDPGRLRFLVQGVLDGDRRGKPYGQIPWRLGLLEPARAPSGASSSAQEHGLIRLQCCIRRWRRNSGSCKSSAQRCRSSCRYCWGLALLDPSRPSRSGSSLCT